MDKNTIKKELYKQKPLAQFHYTYDGFKYYFCFLNLNGIEEEIYFRIPLSDCAETLTDEIQAHFLIRWLV
jgi:hypothetical protein